MVKKRKAPSGRWNLWTWAAGLAPLVGLGCLVFIASLRDLPDTEALANPRINLATRVYAADGLLLGSYYAENRADARFEELPVHLVDALISTEDVRYAQHSGVDFKSLARAIAFLGKRGGGSTLSQQLAKQLFTDAYDRVHLWERALLQKPKEWIIASRLERHYTKEEIIVLYLNRYDFLNQAVGVKSAAGIYFDKGLADLNVEESATLVGMLKNSALFNPRRRPELVLNRRRVVLGQMAKYGKITRAEADSLAELPLGLNFQRVSHDEGIAPYFREKLRAELGGIFREKNDHGDYVLSKADGAPYDVYRDGLTVHTTLDSRLQRHAEEAVHSHLGDELQGAFNQDLKSRGKSEWPFFIGIERNVREAIMGHAIRESNRYKRYVGKLCPECNRPGFYIKKHEDETWICNAEKGGCSHVWPRLTQDEIEEAFDKEVAMHVFTHQGPVDTLLTPRDSIKYHKSLLHAGLMSVEPATGHIKAWVGGIDYRFFQYDNVGQSKRQVGSVFKPFVYATALRHGMSRCTEVPNQRICIPLPGEQEDWCPDNSDFAYGDVVTLEYALANSMNTISAKLIKDYGPETVIQLAHSLGIESEIAAVPSIALGACQLTLKEITSANAALVNGGVFVKPTFIARIEDKFGNVIYSPQPVIRQGLDARTARTVVEMMKGVVEGAYNFETGQRKGTGVRLRFDAASRSYDGLDLPMAGKTGTTQNNTDGWFMALTPDLVTGIWVGAQDPAVRFSTTTYGQGANTALPIFGYYMHAALDDPELHIEKRDFPRPLLLAGDTLDCKTQIEFQRATFGGDDDSDLFK